MVFVLIVGKFFLGDFVGLVEGKMHEGSAETGLDEHSLIDSWAYNMWFWGGIEDRPQGIFCFGLLSGWNSFFSLPIGFSFFRCLDLKGICHLFF